MPPPLRAGAPLDERDYAGLLQRLALDGCKWDLQLGDRATVAPFPLVLESGAARELGDLAQALARELFALVERLQLRRELHPRLAVPRAVRP